MSAGEVNAGVGEAIRLANQGRASAVAGEYVAEETFAKLVDIAQRIGGIITELDEAISGLDSDTAGAFMMACTQGEEAAETLAAATFGSENGLTAMALLHFGVAAEQSKKAQMVVTGLVDLFRSHASALLGAKNGIEENAGAVGTIAHAENAINEFGTGIHAASQYKA